MVAICLALLPLALVLSLPGSYLARALGRRLNAIDSPGVAGQVKAERRKVPNTGGIAVFWSFALPVLGALALAHLLSPERIEQLVPAAAPFLSGVREQTPIALVLLGCLFGLHLMGVIDDRRPLGPYVKLAAMFGLSAIVVVGGETRLLTMLDAHAGGAWLSVLVTILWFVVVTNAMNFMDNMDGLSAGVGAIASGLFLAAALVNGQWFVGACLALLLGSLLGFLHFNFPKSGGATLFLGDGGSLVIGFLLAFLTTRTTYVQSAGAPLSPFGESESVAAGPWYALLMPLFVLAIPLYDFASVVLIRLAQGKSPFVGDLQHFSHRLVRHGLSRRAAVVVLYGFTAMTGIGGISLASLAPWQAVLAGVQVLLILLVLAVFEWTSAPRAGDSP